MRLLPAIFGLACIVSLPASAHQIWIEQINGNARLYFGEFGDNLRETSPGTLDKLPSIEAQVVTLEGNTSLTPKKTADSFDLGTRITRGQVILAQVVAELAEVQPGVAVDLLDPDLVGRRGQRDDAGQAEDRGKEAHGRLSK